MTGPYDDLPPSIHAPTCAARTREKGHFGMEACDCMACPTCGKRREVDMPRTIAVGAPVYTPHDCNGLKAQAEATILWSLSLRARKAHDMVPDERESAEAEILRDLREYSSGDAG